MKRQTIIVTGAGGFIGAHLCKRLTDDGHDVYGIDIKPIENFGGWPTEYTEKFTKKFITADLREKSDDLFQSIAHNEGRIDRVYHLAADMGGIGFIESHKAQIVRNNTRINLNTIDACRKIGAKRFLFTSSACIYPGYKQTEADVTPLKESDAYPADAEDGYGWEKLYMERICRHYQEDFGLETRVVRFHNVYGPYGTYEGGREKAPAAITRKVCEKNAYIEIWGDGKQTRSFLYIDDCIEGLLKIMEGSYAEPLNLGSERMVTIDELVDIACDAAQRPRGSFNRIYKLDAPTGVRGRNSDNTLVSEVTGWFPRVSLEEGMRQTYLFISSEMERKKTPATWR